MNPFNHDYFLGYINEVTPQFIKIHFPSSTLLDKFHFKGTHYSGGNVGNFIVIEGEEFGFLGRVVELILPDSERKSISEKAIKEDETSFHPSGKAELLLSFDVFNPAKIQKTVTKYPSIGAKVYSCSDKQIELYVKEFGRNNNSPDDDIYAEIGKLTSNDAICNISLNALFGRHCAVVGTTGGGKSWTTATLIETITTHTKNKVILIDATGEYKGTINLSCSLGQDTYFSFKSLSNSEFCFLFREHSPNTVSALCEAINSLRFIELGVFTDGVKVGLNAETTNDTIRTNIHKLKDTNFDITQLSAQIKNECIKINPRGVYEEDSFKLSYCSHLMSRINLFLNSPTIRKSLGIDPISNSKEVTEVVDEFLFANTTDSVLRIGFEDLSYDFSIREIIVDFIASKLLNIARSGAFKTAPAILFIDEAHQFLNKRINADDDSSFYLHSIDSIAKESRKYGLFLCLTTQMPRDIPIGTLSQIGTFIVHRLINDSDKRAIENAASAANKSALAFLPILGSGEALLVGVEFPMPLLIKINSPKKKPDSHTPKLLKK